MKRLFLLGLVMFAGCNEAAVDVTGEWTVAMTWHDGIPCKGKLFITKSPTDGTFWCQDTEATPAGMTQPPSAPGSFWIMYGVVDVTPKDGQVEVAVKDWGRDVTFFTDVVTVSGARIDGAVISGTR